MKKDKNIKQVSRLTGALLARKGTAKPSQASLSMNQTVINRFEAPEVEPETQNGDHCPLESAIETVKELTTRQNGEVESKKHNIKQNEPKQAVNKPMGKAKASVKKSSFSKSSQVPAENKRIAMTLRMEEESHLKLRIFSAHTRKSCQVILSEALDLYLAENGDKIPLQKIASQHR